MAHVANNTGNQEHYTPPNIVEMARAVMGGIDLDPASNEMAQKWIKAENFYTKENSGLDREWVGRVWMNPPYARGLIDVFVDKIISSKDVTEYIVLVNNTTETKAGQRLLDNSTVVCFPYKRIRFVKPDGTYGKAPLQGQMIVYRGNNSLAFKDIFCKVGPIYSFWQIGPSY